ncbi:MAG TPA: hypothetical protein DHW02_00595 [Ktedonobacter sp.]|nr:hypothetical protein [Ktedonobacter sp.]
MASSFSTNALPISPASQTAHIPLTQQGATGYTSPVAFHRPVSTANTEEMARLGVDAVFCLQRLRVTQQVLHQVERRDRAVLMLQDGQRTLRDVARLLHRNDTEVAQVIVRLLKQGYVEYIGMRR